MNKLARLNKNSHYGLTMANIDYDHFNSPPPPIYIGPVKEKIDNYKRRKKEMKATSVEVIKDVKNICFSIENHPAERESELVIVASTNDDIFEFEFIGPELLQICKGAGLFTGWEKDQKIMELENQNKKILDTNRKLQEKIFHLFECIEELKTPTIENFADEEPTDNVNHPSHYDTGKFECIEVMQEIFGIDAVRDFCKCNAFKYIYRMDRKNGEEDVKKAIWYLNKYLELTETKED